MNTYKIIIILLVLFVIGLNNILVLESFDVTTQNANDINKYLHLRYKDFLKLTNININTLQFAKLVNEKNKLNRNLTQGEINTIINSTNNAINSTSSAISSKQIKENFDDTSNSNKSECQQSLDELKNLMNELKQSDDESFNTAMTKWTDKRDALVNNFTKDPNIRADFCGSDASKCEPISDYFDINYGTKFDAKHIDERYQPDVDSCMRSCRGNKECEWITFNRNNNTCTQQAANPKTGSVHGFLTDTGSTVSSDRYYENNEIKRLKTSRSIDLDSRISFSDASCETQCKNTPNCKHWQWYSNDGTCILMGKGNNEDGIVSSIKKRIINTSLPDNSPYIINNMDSKKPERKDFNTPIPVGNIICQQCEQAQGSNSVSDSTQVKLEQLQQCVINVDKNSSNSSNTTNSNNKSDDSKPVDSNTKSDTTQTTNSNTNSSSNTLLYIGYGVAALICLLAIIFSIIFTIRFFRNNSN